MRQKLRVECVGCGSPDAIVISDRKYHGYRGCCPHCGSNWPES